MTDVESEREKEREEKKGLVGAVGTVGWLVSTRLTAGRNIPRENTARQRGDDTRYALLRARSVTQPARNAILLHIRRAAAVAVALPLPPPHRPLSPRERRHFPGRSPVQKGARPRTYLPPETSGRFQDFTDTSSLWSPTFFRTSFDGNGARLFFFRTVEFIFLFLFVVWEIFMVKIEKENRRRRFYLIFLGHF